MHPGRSQDPDYKGTSKRELVLKGESYLNSRKDFKVNGTFKEDV